MSRSLGCALILAVMLSGCAVEAVHLYPVTVAASTQPASASILSGNVVSVPPESSSVTFRTPGGEKLSGTCAYGSPAGINSQLRDSWDSVYGQGDYLAHVVGSLQHCAATLAGSKGSSFRIEFYRETPGTPLKGIGLDSSGNVFKLGI